MSLPVLLLAVLLPLLVLAAIALLLLALLRPDATGLDRRQLGIRWAGIGLGLLAAVLLLGTGSLPGRLGHGALAGTAPLVGAGVLIAVVLLGERRLSGTLGTVRRASLQPHGPIEVLPRITTAFTSVVVIGLSALMVVTTALASPDDQGRAGRALSMVVAGEDGQTISATSGPYPGSWSTLPAGIVLLLLAGLAALALRGIVSRRSASDPGDLLLRRRSATAVLGAVQLGSGALAVVIAMFAIVKRSQVAANLAGAGAQVPAGTAVIEAVEPIMLVLGVVAVAWGLMLVLAPSLLAGRDRSRRTEAVAPLAEGAVR